MHTSTAIWVQRNPTIYDLILRKAREIKNTGSAIHRDIVYAAVCQELGIPGRHGLKGKITEIIEEFPEEFHRFSSYKNAVDVVWLPGRSG